MRFNRANLQRLVCAGAFLGTAFYLTSVSLIELKKVFR